MGPIFLISLVGLLMIYFWYTKSGQNGAGGTPRPKNPDIYRGPVMVRMFYGREQRSGILSLDSDIMRLTVFADWHPETVEQAATEGHWLYAKDLEILCEAGTMNVLSFRDMTRTS